MSDILADLRWRGLIAQSTDEQALGQALKSGQVTFYGGFDPTAASLHVGHLVLILTMRRLQDAGHRPLALVGGATGMIGDPRDVGERALNSTEVVTEWVQRIRGQIEPFLEFSGPAAAQMVNNLDWTKDLSAIDFLRDVGKHYRLGTMLAKDIVARRLRSDEGISFTEFSYQILQGMDFLELLRRHNCTLQVGGNDQWGNLLSGVELIRKAEGVATHALTTPLITKSDGSKMGKSEGGAIWLDPELTSPYAFYQFWLNTADADVVRYLKVFTFRTRAEIESLATDVQERPYARAAQQVLAQDVTTLLHGRAATEAVMTASKALFGRADLRDLDAATLADAVAEIPSGALDLGEATILDALVAAGLSTGRNAARRTVADGGAYLNNDKVTDPDRVLTENDLLAGNVALLRRGRRNLGAIRAG
ncbi:tyrosine--tRNA ligase [Pseudactinotalea sp. Z1739]|uniref:tyrosine--tRNA ligase n=1 Tax=Pseudactinotalea sp. Z1739 TaxID=3413028 RepID=UPI003C7ADA5F